MDGADQIYIFLVCVLTGMAGGLLYEPFCALRRFAGGKTAASLVFDTLFFLAFAGLCVSASSAFAFPDFRVYMFLGDMLGLILYLKSIHRIVDFLQKVCYNRARKVLKRRKSSKNSKKKEVQLL